MPTLIIALVMSLLGMWPTITAAGQPRGPGEPPAAQAPERTEDQIKQVQEAHKLEGFHPGAADCVVGRRYREVLCAYQAL